MTRQFLESLVGLTTSEASNIVSEQGFSPYVVDEGAILPAIAVFDQIILYHKDNIITLAQANDPQQVQVENDQPLLFSNLAAKALCVLVSTSGGAILGAAFFGIIGLVIGTVCGFVVGVMANK